MATDADTGRAPDHRRQSRRRGQTLNDAIFRATIAELAEVGYAALTMERVAERARASKASLYRRWPTRMELVIDAVNQMVPDLTETPDTGFLRGDLLAALRQTARLLAGPAGEALRGLISDTVRDPALTADVRRRSQGPWRRTIQEITRRAVERREIEASAITDRRLEAGQALLRQHFLFTAEPIPDEVIIQIVDEVMLPLFRCRC